MNYCPSWPGATPPHGPRKSLRRGAGPYKYRSGPSMLSKPSLADFPLPQPDTTSIASSCRLPSSTNSSCESPTQLPTPTHTPALGTLCFWPCAALEPSRRPILTRILTRTPRVSPRPQKTPQNTSTMAPVIKLNSGYDMPQVGFGLWKVDNAVCADVVYNAIKAGYRLFDGACGKSCLRMLFPYILPPYKTRRRLCVGCWPWPGVAHGATWRAGDSDREFTPPLIHPPCTQDGGVEFCRTPVGCRCILGRDASAKRARHDMWITVELCQAPGTP